MGSSLQQVRLETAHQPSWAHRAVSAKDHFHAGSQETETTRRRTQRRNLRPHKYRTPSLSSRQRQDRRRHLPPNRYSTEFTNRQETSPCLNTTPVAKPPERPGHEHAHPDVKANVGTLNEVCERLEKTTRNSKASWWCALRDVAILLVLNRSPSGFDWRSLCNFS